MLILFFHLWIFLDSTGLWGWRPERPYIQPSRSQDSQNTKTKIKRDCFLAHGEASIDLLELRGREQWHMLGLWTGCAATTIGKGCWYKLAPSPSSRAAAYENSGGLLPELSRKRLRTSRRQSQRSLRRFGSFSFARQWAMLGWHGSQYELLSCTGLSQRTARLANDMLAGDGGTPLACWLQYSWSSARNARSTDFGSRWLYGAWHPHFNVQFGLATSRTSSGPHAWNSCWQPLRCPHLAYLPQTVSFTLLWMKLAPRGTSAAPLWHDGRVIETGLAWWSGQRSTWPVPSLLGEAPASQNTSAGAEPPLTNSWSSLAALLRTACTNDSKGISYASVAPLFKRAW